MRKFISLVLVLCILLSLVACGSSGQAVTYSAETETRFNELLENWLPNSGLLIGSSEDDVDAVVKERDTDYKNESRLKIFDSVALRQWDAKDVELMFSDKNGLFGFWIVKSGTCVSTAEATLGTPMAEGTTGGYTWLVDDLFIWAEDYDDGTCFFLVCTAVEADEKYSTNIELLLKAVVSNDSGTQSDTEFFGEQIEQSSQTTADDGFVSDWTEGNENIYGYGEQYNLSVEQLFRKYGFVTQDQWLYYYRQEGGIYKMPVNGTSDRVFRIMPLSADQNIYKMSVYKDWVYFWNGYYEFVRLRTDGMVMEQVPIQTDELWVDDGYYIAHGQLYYVSRTQKSASDFSYSLRCMNLDTGDDVEVCQGISRIYHGYQDSMMVCSADKHYYRIDLDGNVLAEYEDDSLMPGCVIDPATEMFQCDEGFIWLNGNVKKDDFIRYVQRIDESRYYFSEDLNAVFYEEDWDLWCADWNTGEQYCVNSDPCRGFFSFGDGYLYYATWQDKNGKAETMFCRVLPDGTGWEDVSWMFY